MGQEETFRVDKIFIGYDPRQAVAFNVLQHSILARATRPVSIRPLVLDTLPIRRHGLTPFTYSRFLVPWLCNFEGRALFLDADMLVLDDIGKLFDLFDPAYAVQVVEQKERFEWGSLILFNCEHSDNDVLTPATVEGTSCPLHKIGWTDNIGFLPSEWNHTVFYDRPRDDAKLVHFTAGIPIHPEIHGCEYTTHWMREADAMNRSRDWDYLMGRSVHAPMVKDHVRQKEAAYMRQKFLESQRTCADA